MLLFSIWLVVFLISIFADAYFAGNVKKDVSFIWVCVFWPVFFPFAGAWSLYDCLNKLGEKHRARREKLKNIRVAEESQTEKLLRESEQEVEDFVEQLSQNKL